MLLALEVTAHSQNDEYAPSAPVEGQISHWAYTKTQMARALQPAPPLCSSTHHIKAGRLSGLSSASRQMMGSVKQPENKLITILL